MQINLPDDCESLVRQKAADAGFGDHVGAYVAHLIASDEYEDYGAPIELSLRGKCSDEIEAMISDGIKSGPATPMTDDDWGELRARLSGRNCNAE